MSWQPQDLVSDADLQHYERDILTGFGVTTMQDKRGVALEHWLFPILRARGFDPFRLVTRAEVDLALGFTAAAYTDVTAASRSADADDLDLAAIFATPATDALYVGSTQPFRGLFLTQADAVSSATGTLAVQYWNGAWTALTVTDATAHASGKTLSGGGSVTWTLPVDWQRREMNGSARLYWAKVTVSAVPTGAMAGQLGVIRSSALCAPATFRTLQLVFQEAPTQQDGPWREKAEFYKGEADLALERALVYVASEFDTDDSDQVSETEAGQTTEQIATGWALERM